MEKVLETYSTEQIGRMGALTDVNGVAGVLGCSRRQALYLCSRGVVKAVKTGNRWRVNTRSLLEYAGLA